MTVREIGAHETRLAFAAMRALRTHLADEDAFARRVDEVQRPEGYRLAGVFEDGVASAAAVAGFRVLNNLAWGRFLYVDDLSTLEGSRRRGHARALLDWLVAEAQRLRCDELHLDSGVGPARAAAHRLYLGAGYVISSHHFARAAGG
jgi:GNAT superfamily N-acetyltransferase